MQVVTQTEALEFKLRMKAMKSIWKCKTEVLSRENVQKVKSRDWSVTPKGNKQHRVYKRRSKGKVRGTGDLAEVKVQFRVTETERKGSLENKLPKGSATRHLQQQQADRRRTPLPSTSQRRRQVSAEKHRGTLEEVRQDKTSFLRAKGFRLQETDSSRVVFSPHWS